MNCLKDTLELKVNYQRVEEFLSKLRFPIYFLGMEYVYDEEKGQEVPKISIDKVYIDESIHKEGMNPSDFNQMGYSAFLGHSGSIVCFNEETLKAISNILHQNCEWILWILKERFINFEEIYNSSRESSNPILKWSCNSSELHNVYRSLLRSLRRYQSKYLNTKYIVLSHNDSYYMGHHLAFRRYWCKNPLIHVKGFNRLSDARKHIRNDEHNYFAIISNGKLVEEYSKLKYVLFASYDPDFINNMYLIGYKDWFYNYGTLYHEFRTMKDARKYRSETKDDKIFKYTCIMRISDGKIWHR